jgi:hypothetical protein
MIPTVELYWIAGFLEGEGCFSVGIRKEGRQRKAIRVSAVQVQKQPLDRLQKWLGGSIGFVKASHPQHQPKWQWYLGSYNAAGTMMTLYSLMSPKRQFAIRQALDVWKAQFHKSADRKACPQGHAYTPENTKYSKRKYVHSEGKVRICRTCLRAKWRRKDYRRRAILQLVRTAS